MAKIYTSQVAMKSAGQHKFKADPIQNYIAEGLRSVSTAAQQTAEMIIQINDRDAASKMEEAARRSQQIIDEWSDFEGDYLNKMEVAAVEPWDETFATLDKATQNRFLMNNPEARDIFQLKVASAATERSYEYAKARFKRDLPNIASGIVDMQDPVAMQARMKEIQEDIDASFLKKEDRMEMISSLYYDVATSAIYSAIGRRDFELANGMVQNDNFMEAVSSKEREQLKTAIRNAELNAFTTTSGDSATKQRLDNSVNLGTGIVDAIMGDESLGARDQRFKLASGFLSAVLSGDSSSLDSFAWAGKIPMYEFLDAVSKAPESERQAVVRDIVAKAFPNSRELDNAIGLAQANVSMLLSKNEDKNFDEWSSDDVSLAFELVSTYQDVMSFSPELRKAFAPLEKIVGRQILADTIELSGLGPSEFEYSRTGVFDSFKDLNPALQIASALSKPIGTTDVVYDKLVNQTLADATYKTAARLNDGNTPENGTYVESLARTAVVLGNMNTNMKRALGIEGVDADTLSMAMWKKRYQLASDGKLNERMSGGALSGPYLPEEEQTKFVKQLGSLWHGSSKSGLEGLGKLASKEQRLAENSLDVTPVEESEDYTMLKDLIVSVAPNANPDTEVMKRVATYLRKGRHEYNGWISDLFTDVDAYLRGSDNYVERKYKQVMNSPITE